MGGATKARRCRLESRCLVWRCCYNPPSQQLLCRRPSDSSDSSDCDSRHISILDIRCWNETVRPMAYAATATPTDTASRNQFHGTLNSLTSPTPGSSSRQEEFYVTVVCQELGGPATCDWVHGIMLGYWKAQDEADLCLALVTKMRRMLPVGSSEIYRLC